VALQRLSSPATYQHQPERPTVIIKPKQNETSDGKSLQSTFSAVQKSSNPVLRYPQQRKKSLFPRWNNNAGPLKRASSANEYSKQSQAIVPGSPAFSAQDIKVPYPIFVLNLPKSGTTTIWQYFECGLGPNRAVHWWTTQHGKRIGPCVEKNIQQFQRPPLEGCGNFDVWVDFGYAETNACFLPSVHGLEALYDAYPNATLLFIERDLESWYQSASNWGKMFLKWKRACRSTFFPNIPADKPIRNEDFRQFYQWHTQHIRQFALDHPSMTYLEPPLNMSLSSAGVGNWLEEHIGIEASCWGNCRPDGHNAKCAR
jgi:hypothetical protein